MKRLLLLFVMGLCCISFFAQPKEPLYISPNNDGVQDVLTIPLQIKDKRYIMEWNLYITDAQGTIIRTIGNKEKRPEKLTFKTFFQQLFKAKTGVMVPASITWNGIMESGEPAPDGTYFYYVTAKDDNGNFSKTEPLQVVVDHTFPVIELKRFPDLPASIFSPDGISNKATLRITQTGSVEEKWEAKITTALGTVVRILIWQNEAPQSFDWDGKNDSGVLVPDGVYSYSISCIDRAGNAVSDNLSNIVVNTVKPVINIAIETNAFSPNGTGKKDTLKLIPVIDTVQGLMSWDLRIVDANNLTYRTYTGNGKPPANIDWDGKDETGNRVAEGSYQGTLSALYQNGHNPQVQSPKFVLNVTPPQLTLTAQDSIFSPNGDNVKDVMIFEQKTTSSAMWKGEIKSAEGKLIRSYLFGSTLPQTIEWDGFTDAKMLADDGMYTYSVTGDDSAGNTGNAQTASFELNTGTTEVILTANKIAFSPQGDKTQNTITFTPVVKTKSRITSYILRIQNAGGSFVRTIEGTGTFPAKFDWNGSNDAKEFVADGKYLATLETISENGAQAKSTAPEFIVDTVVPTVSVTTPYTIFSPNGDTKKDILPFVITTSKKSLWTAEIFNAANKVVRHYEWDGDAKSFDWDGKDEAGNLVADGTYSFVIKTHDLVGNKAEAKCDKLVLDTRIPKAYITLSEVLIAPVENSKRHTQKIGVSTSIPTTMETWKITIKKEGSNEPVKTWTNLEQPTFPSQLSWNGENNEGKLVEGTFYVEMQIQYAKGDEVLEKSSPFICWITPPALQVSTAPVYFSPDNDGADDDLFITLKAKSLIPFTTWSFEIRDPQNGLSFWQTKGNVNITEQLIWDGKSNKGELVQSATDYPYTFTVTDEIGMTSKVDGFISVDVLVLRFGNILKIQVPSIVFADSRDDFMGLDNVVIEKNNFVLKRIATILNKFKDYKVTIEGHANKVERTASEAAYNLALSDRRAKAIRERLIKLGVDGNRLSTLGKGDTQPVIPFDDRPNWWKNRRVEFILIK